MAGDTISTASTSPVAFNYAELEADVANEARAVVERYRRRQQAYVIDTGLDLLAVKARLDHGLFLAWVEAEMGMKPRSAQRAMTAAEVLGAKSDTLSYLPPTALYELSARSTPEPVRNALIRRIDDGEFIRAEIIHGEIRAAKDEAQRNLVAEREAKRRAALSDEERAEEDLIRARGEKSREARRRRAERNWSASEVERRREEESSLEAARALVDMLGIDRATAYLDRYGNAGLRKFSDVVREAMAQATPPSKIDDGPPDITIPLTEDAPQAA